VRLTVVGAVLVVVERAIIGEVGSPVVLLRALAGVGAAADPVGSVLALMALVAELLVGHLLVVLALRWLCVLPGAVGRLAGRISLLLTPAMARRLVDLLVGGALLAQTTLAATPGAPGVPGTSPGWPPEHPRPAVAISSTVPARVGPAAERGGDLARIVLDPAARRRPVDVTEPGPARPTPRRSAAPLPPWLGGGPSRSMPEHTVEPGDTLWDIAAAHLPPTERSPRRIHRYWPQVYRANRSVVGADPDLIHPGSRLDVPPFRRDRP
jgi:nucleoid-associated protein YgaU